LAEQVSPIERRAFKAHPVWVSGPLLDRRHERNNIPLLIEFGGFGFDARAFSSLNFPSLYQFATGRGAWQEAEAKYALTSHG
jgi:hypothetical protein